MILDLFAGPGGWDEGLRQLGRDDVVGIENDPDACATRRARGHKTIEIDVALLDPAARFPIPGEIAGLIASPPCQSFSQGGERRGLADLAQLYEHARACLGGWQPISRHEFADRRSALVLEPLRWALALCPPWIALEQVPHVLPVWEVTAELLRAHGWLTWTGILCAADYGVPQKRHRAILMAHRQRQPETPPPTHAEYPQPSLFGEQLAPWVCMADALGWDIEDRLGFPRLDDLGTSETGYRERDRRPASEPAEDIAAGRTEYQDRAGTDAIRLSLAEALVLQDFPADYPIQGGHTSSFRQVGNAVPPTLARAVLAELLR